MKSTTKTALRLLASLCMIGALYLRANNPDNDNEPSAMTATVALYTLVFGVAGIGGVALFLFLNALGVLVVMVGITIILALIMIVMTGGEADEQRGTRVTVETETAASEATTDGDPDH